MPAPCLQWPALGAWAETLAGLAAWACHLLLGIEGCQPFTAEEACAAAGWTLAGAALALLAAVALLAAAVRRLGRWLTMRDGGRMVEVSAEVLKELRKAQPQQYPAQRHMFAACPAAAVDPYAPLLCAVCHASVAGAAMAAPDLTALHCCSACGLVTHDGCSRRAGKTCRPLCCQAGGQLAHFWQAVGTVLETPEAAEGAATTCMYCGDPADSGSSSSGGSGGSGSSGGASAGAGAGGDLTLSAPEPLWRCALCASICHVHCFCEAHPQLPTVGAKLHSLMLTDGGGGSDSGGSSRRVNERGRPQLRPASSGGSAGVQQLQAAGRDSGGSDEGAEEAPAAAAVGAAAAGGSSGTPAAALAGDKAKAGAAGAEYEKAAASGGAAANGSGSIPGCATLRRRRRSSSQQRSGASWLQALAGVVGGGGGGAGGGGASASPGAVDESGYNSDSESEDVSDAWLQRQRWQRRRRRRLLSQDIGRLDVCNLGPNRRSILPPTAVRPAMRSGGNSQTQLDAAAAAQDGSGGSGSGSGKVQQPAQEQQQQADGREAAAHAADAAAAAPNSPFAKVQQANGNDGSGGSSNRGAGGGSSKRKSSWWRRLYKPTRLQWQDYQIDQLPTGCKPVLVFVNTKSGPQVGTTLRRRFLRCLHPLQVVELPRQKPDAALQLFASVAAHVRILVIGGDGSVAWILSCLEALREERAARGDAGWRPPPVAVLPLGTGNDLARCLGWGGGHGIWQQEGVGTVLSEVQHAAPLHIDRWNVSFGPPSATAPAGPLTPTAKLASMMRRGHVPGTGAAPAAPPLVKHMNNYLGIGVDAKVALEFHQMREQYPAFFTSQLGNKLWYTAVGGKDIVSGHACVNLAQKLQVTCDGRPVWLPPDMEGLLALNINSYMGGVDLWRNSYRLRGSGSGGGGSSSSGSSDDEGWEDGAVGGNNSGGGSGGGGSSGGRRGVQSMQDGRVELVAVYGSWHLGQLQVGLSRAVRLGQGRVVTIETALPLPMQVDGEPWVQPASAVCISRRGQALMLRRVQSKPLARMMQALAEVLEESEQRGTISAAQHHALMAELAARLQPLLLHPAG